MQVTDLAACEFEPGSASRVMLGREGGGMLVYDLEAQKPAAKVRISLQQTLGLVICHSMGSRHFPACTLNVFKTPLAESASYMMRLAGTKIALHYLSGHRLLQPTMISLRSDTRSRQCLKAGLHCSST